jgi:hypothetical protein
VHELADPAQQEVEVFFAGELLLLVDRAQALALRQGSGEVAWVHRDPDLRPIYAAFVEADDLVLSLNNETLLWLGARDGRPRGRVALGGASLKQLARAPGGLVALLIRAEPQPELLGAVLNGEGDPAVEAALAPAWSLPIQSWSSPASSIGPVVLSRFDPDAWSAVDAATGALLWRAPEAGLSGGFLMTPGALYLGRAGQAGAPGEPPIPAALLRIDPRVSPDAAPRWSLELPSARAPLGIEPSPSPGEVLGATADTFFVFSEEAGALAWVYSFQEGREPGPWANASANAEALFLFFAPTQGGGGRLKRVPILREALPRPGLPPGPTIRPSAGRGSQPAS